MLLKTDLLYTAVGEPIKNGMLRLDEKGTILEVGTQLQGEPSEVEYFKGGLCPGFVNTHCHLELSHLKGKIAAGKGLIEFIGSVQQQRAATEEEIQEAIIKADAEMQASGIVAVGDISNGNSTFAQKLKSKIHYHSFIELFGFDQSQATAILTRGKALKMEANARGLKASIVPHSPYSVSEKLFKLIAEAEHNSPLSIHNQENEAENEFYQKGNGAFYEMLQQFSVNTSHFKPSQQNSLNTYLNWLPKKPLLLVHNTFTSETDLKAAQTMHPKLYWCFCARANQYIEKRLPNIKQFVEAGVKCTLGTDSLASNYGLSILDEMKTIQAKFPEVSTNTLIKWGCKNGAEFLGLNQLGSFEVGKRPGVNQIEGLAIDEKLKKEIQIIPLM